MVGRLSPTRSRRSRLATHVSPIPRILHALTSRSPKDLADRARQIALAKLEALGIGATSGASESDLLLAIKREAGIEGPAGLLAAFRDRVAGASLEAFRDRQRTIGCLVDHWPDLAQRAEARAGRIADGRFDLLGHEGLSFGHPIDWALDPVHNRRAPNEHWSRVPYLDADVVGDHKIVWELNRHQYFVHLGQAAWLGSDDRWSETFFEHVSGWMAANPPKRGINWASSLEIAFRSISWLWALHFFAGASQLSPQLFLQIVTQLRAHGRHVERYISTSFSPNTHLTGEALGLFYLGTMLPELPEAARWQKRGRGWLLDALEFQIRADGGYFEQSIHYHRYTADFYLHFLVLSRLCGEGVPAGLETRLEQILDHLVSLTRADGTTPLIGDDDGGKLLFLDDRPLDDVRSTLLAGAVLLDRADWADLAGPPTEELVWLLGPDAMDRLTTVTEQPSSSRAGSEPLRGSHSNVETGFYVMRSGAEQEKEDFALVRCGPHGALSGGHAHADSLGIDVTIEGRAVLVDPGTGSYTNRGRREWFRSSAAHNTVTVAEQSSSLSSGPFGWSVKANSYASQWVSQAPLDFFEGAHDGFGRLGAGLTHQRSVLYVRDGYWVVRDRLYGGAIPGAMRAHFQFASGLSVDAAGQSLRVRADDGAEVATLTALMPSTWEKREGWMSPAYGRIHAAPAWASRANEPTTPPARLELLTLISRDRAIPVSADCTGGTAWRIGHGDVLIVSREGAGTTQADELGVRGDFDWFWGRLDPNGGWQTVFACGGSALQLDGSPPLRLSGPAKSLGVAVNAASGERESWLEPEGDDPSREAAEALEAWAQHV